MDFDKIEDYYKLFDVQTSSYWNTHYNFGKSSEKKIKKLGKTAINLILINTIVPFLFIYGRSRNDQLKIDQAIKLLDQLPGELNAITRKWKDLGISPNSAFKTQALIELFTKYCSNKKCLECAIGNELLKGVVNI